MFERPISMNRGHILYRQHAYVHSLHNIVLAGYGAGTHIYVIDTGITPTHTDFSGRAAVAGDFLDDGRNVRLKAVANSD